MFKSEQEEVYQSTQEAHTLKVQAVDIKAKEKIKEVIARYDKKIESIEADFLKTEKKIVQEKDEQIKVLQEQHQISLQKIRGKHKFELEETINKYKKRIDELTQSQMDLESANENTVKLKVNEAIGHKYSEIDGLKEEIKRLKATNEKLEDKLGVKNNHISQREKQLNLYTQSIDKEKQLIKEQAIAIINELKGLASLDPLKQYLKITEKEISKVEIDLGKSPLHSTDRPRLEEILENLVRQRDSLKIMVEDANSRVQLKIKSILKLVHSDTLIPLPPLPPRD